MVEMRNQFAAQMNAQMTQFMEVLTKVPRGQEELRNLVENSRRDDNDGGLFDDVSCRIENNHNMNEYEHPSYVPYNPINNNQGKFPPSPPSDLLAGRRDNHNSAATIN